MKFQAAHPPAAALLLLLCAIVATCGSPAGAAPVLEEAVDRPLRYRPDGHDFVRVHGAEFFNRPLYGSPTAFRVDAGDLPEFTMYLPGRGGNLRLGVRSGASGARWLHAAESIESRYRPGMMLYTIRDPLLGPGATLDVRAIAMHEAEGLVMRVELTGGRGAAQPLELVWAYGGVTGQKGARDGDIGTERVPMREYFQLKPEYCRDNAIRVDGPRFTLRAKPGTIAGTSLPASAISVADAAGWSSPADLLKSAAAGADDVVDQPLAVARVPLRAGQPVFVMLQRHASATGGAATTTTAATTTAGATTATTAPVYTADELPRVFADAEAHVGRVANQLVVDTPDPFINAAAAALNVAAEGTWDERQGAVMHGAVAWRRKLLGWRGAYWGDALGRHDRTRRHLDTFFPRQNTEPIPPVTPPADADANLARSENALHSNGDLTRSHYDMNLVAIDALFRHLLWTGDLAYARRTWPVLERHLAWERRLFRRPFGRAGHETLPLYEGYAAIWASDDVAYNGGGTTHTSAYNLYHNRMAARVAALIGEDPAPYRREAELIERAMRRELWLPDRGWYAEYKDLLGLGRVHPNAALWTFYHTVDSAAATPLEAWQMSRFVDTQLAHFPLRGPGVPDDGRNYTLPTTSWMPYAWSTNNVVMAEASHAALAMWQAGRADRAIRLFKGCLLDSMFMGACPGNAGMCTTFDMARGETQRDFADACGALSRTFVEGLFGVRPDALAGELLIAPGFPAEWDRASIRHADVSVTFTRNGLTEHFIVEPRFARPMKLRLRVPALRDGVAGVRVNGAAADWEAAADRVGAPAIDIVAPQSERHAVTIVWKGDAPASAKEPGVIAAGETLEADVAPARVVEVNDPQNALADEAFDGGVVRGRASGVLGHRTVFARVEQGEFQWWVPVSFEIRPPHEIVATAVQEPGRLSFRVRNNTRRAIEAPAADVVVGKTSSKRAIQIPAGGESAAILLSDGVEPGTNRVEVEIGESSRITGFVTNWQVVDGEASPPVSPNFEAVDLGAHFNDSVTQIFRNRYLAPRSPFVSLAVPTQGIGSWCKPQTQFDVDDAGLREAARRGGGGGGRIVLPGGVPLRTPGAADAKNVLFTSQWDNYPNEAVVPLAGRAAHAYLLMAGSTHAMQSRFDNGEVIVTYADGTAERLALHNPTTWWPIDRDYVVDDYAFRLDAPLPPRVDLKTGAVRVLDPRTFKGRGGDGGGTVPGGAATVLDLPLRADKELKSLTVRTLANEVVIGLMSVTLRRE